MEGDACSRDTEGALKVMPSQSQQRRMLPTPSIAENGSVRAHVRAHTRIALVDCDRSVAGHWSPAEAPQTVGIVSSTSASLDACHDATLAVVDVTPSGKLSLEAVRHLRSGSPTLPIIAVTHYPSIDLAVRVVRAGADHCLTLPIYLEELLHLEASRGCCHPVVEDFGLPTLGHIEWEYIARVLSHAAGNISVAARILGIRRTTLQRKLKKYPERGSELHRLQLRRSAK